jgi:hypothetical protein
MEALQQSIHIVKVVSVRAVPAIFIITLLKEYACCGISNPLPEK